MVRHAHFWWDRTPLIELVRDHRRMDVLATFKNDSRKNADVRAQRMMSTLLSERPDRATTVSHAPAALYGLQGKHGKTVGIYVNILRPRQNNCHFAGDIFNFIFVNKNVWISINTSRKFVPSGQIDNISALVQIMAWRRVATSHIGFRLLFYDNSTHVQDPHAPGGIRIIYII